MRRIAISLRTILGGNLLLLLLLLAVAPTAGAEIRVVDTTTGAGRTLLKQDPLAENPSLARWTDDGAAIVANPGASMLRVGVADRSITHLLELDAAISVGPGLRYVEFADELAREETLVLRRPDGGRIGVYRFGASDDDTKIAWSLDGARVAIGSAPQLKVIDTASGAVVLDTKVGDFLQLGVQAFAPDGSALLAADAQRVQRIDVPSGATSTVLEDAEGEIAAGGEWSRTGTIAVNLFGGFRVVGGREIRAPTGSFDVPAIWTPAGDALTFAYSGRRDDCNYPSQGVATIVPGQARRVILPARNRKVLAYAWSPDGTKLAVELTKVKPPRSKPRGKRHPWPDRVARYYALHGRRANRAVRRIVLRATRALRRGAGRERTLLNVRLSVARLDLNNNAALEMMADALDPWLRAAGFQRIQDLAELECGAG